ncbi:hypothetical protein SERLA73DRAFT_58942 [Serpula lacrymans var. lacrymans S7.3]|uniref:Uncharacterized protein n=1 Tax=Serpula lacrymans var. lacrymans (strain S7.3) TaxID=936435 RepID=F8Q6Q4_SERL3|nr:hypothetical protein SERLA73DRAFT_58942 [Serpula lacrymans var. lacrymans S7.3]
MLLQPFLHIFRYALQPVAPFTWFGLGVTSLDVVAALRLCVALRQVKDHLRLELALRRAKGEKVDEPEDRSFARDAMTTLTVVYGGEALAGKPHHPSPESLPI